MESLYNIFKSDLMGMHYQTALLEACDWDEELLEEFASHLQMAFHYITGEGCTFEQGKVLLKEILEINDWKNGQYEIVLKLIDLHATEMKQFMEGEQQ
tara:strand:- start:3191 stop:3484 length:294 start_codon:yes stop_codon:yes gene_type:complete